MSCPRGTRRFALSIGLAIALGAPAPVAAQAKDGFVQALIDVSQAVAGVTGDEGRSLQASVAAMADGLAQWDAAVSRVEAGFAGAIANARPLDAARMHATLGATYLERGRVADALTHLDLAATLDPSFAPAHLLRGLGHSRSNRFEPAAAAYSAARRLDPESARVAYLYLGAARGAASSEERSEALGALLKAVSGGATGAEPTDITILPLDLLDDGSVDVPLFAPGAYAETFGHLAQARYAEALASLRAAVAADPLVTDAALATPQAREAATALAAADAKAAVQAFSSVPGGGRSSEVQRLLGLSYWRLADYAKSLEYLRAAMALNPTDERARVSLADVLVASGDRAAARAILLDTARRFPGSGQAHWRLGRLAEDLGDEAAARLHYEVAARATPVAGASIVYRAIGRLHHNALDLDAAARAYERRAALTPLSAQAHLDLGGVYRAQERLDEALTEYLAAALVDPASAHAFASSGQVRADMGDDEGAVALLRSAVRIDANHGEARYALSRALLRVGRADESRLELAAFERIQAAAMDAQRRRFEDNSRALESALNEGQAAPPPNATSPSPAASPKDIR